MGACRKSLVGDNQTPCPNCDTPMYTGGYCRKCGRYLSAGRGHESSPAPSSDTYMQGAFGTRLGDGFAMLALNGDDDGE